MADQTDVEELDELADDAAEPKKKGGGRSLIIGLVGAVLLGSATGYGVMSGLVPIGGPSPEEIAAEEAAKAQAEAEEKAKKEASPPAFLALEPLTIGLAGPEGVQQLRLGLSVETSEKHLGELEGQTDRILDALNTLLRAIDARDLAEPSSMDRLRAQMLRRVRVATNPAAVRDLLITEFFLF